MHRPQQKKFFSIYVSSLNIIVIRFISPLLNFDKNDALEVSGRPTCHRSGWPLQVPFSSDTRFSSRLRGGSSHRPTGHKTTDTAKRIPRSGSPHTRGRLVLGPHRERSRCRKPAQLASSGRDPPRFAARPQVANEAGSDAHAQTRAPRTERQRLRPRILPSEQRRV